MCACSKGQADLSSEFRISDDIDLIRLDTIQENLTSKKHYHLSVAISPCQHHFKTVGSRIKIDPDVHTNNSVNQNQTSADRGLVTTGTVRSITSEKMHPKKISMIRITGEQSFTDASKHTCNH